MIIGIINIFLYIAVCTFRPSCDTQKPGDTAIDNMLDGNRFANSRQVNMFISLLSQYPVGAKDFFSDTLCLYIKSGFCISIFPDLHSDEDTITILLSISDCSI